MKVILLLLVVGVMWCLSFIKNPKNPKKNKQFGKGDGLFQDTNADGLNIWKF